MVGWGDIVSGTQLTIITNTEQLFTESITLKPGELVHLQVKVLFDAAPDADVKVNIYTTLDDSSEEWDSEPFTGGRVNLSGDNPGKISFPIQDIYKFRIGVVLDQSMGIVAALTADIKWRLDNVDLTTAVS